jgi:hypothetical protein
MALLQIIDAIERELRTAGMYDGMTTSEMRAAWKKTQGKSIAIDVQSMQDDKIVV